MNFYRNSDESDFEGGIAGLCFLGIIIVLILAALCNAAEKQTTEARDSRNAQAGEIPVIRKAAERNAIRAGTPDWYLLLAIRKAENGKTGREFGILNPKANTLELQAAWCAATIMAQHRRYGSLKVDEGYIRNLQQRYCPLNDARDVAGLNRNWAKNVTYWFKKIQESK